MIMQNVLGKESRYFYMGISMVAVILHHLVLYPIRYHSIHLPLDFLFINGHYGVDVFMFISAYGLGYSYNNNKLSTFYLRRIKRIYPMYLLFLIIACLFVKNSIYDGLKEILRQIICLPIFDHGINNIEWFIPSLITLYIIYPLIYTIVEKSIHYKYGSLILYTLTVFSTYFFCRFFNDLFTMRFPIYVIGVYTYFFVKDKKYNQLLILYCYSGILSFMTYHQNLTPTMCLPMILLLLDKINLANKTKKCGKYISLIGIYSLEIYLAQMIGTKFVMRLDLPISILIILALTTTLVLAPIFHYFQTFFYKIRTLYE